jgi:hypothetical protein
MDDFYEEYPEDFYAEHPEQWDLFGEGYEDPAS